MTDTISHEFVQTIPERADMAQGVLYVSIDYAVTSHLCACGCGNEAVLGLSPVDWSVTFNGAAVSMSPSVGNWSFPCRSHYWIKQDAIRWAPKLTDEQIATLRAGQRLEFEEYYEKSPALTESAPSADQSWWSKMLKKLWRSEK